MGINLEIEGLIDPCLPTPTPFARNWANRCFIITCHFHRLRLLAQHEIPNSLRSNCVPWTQSCNHIKKKTFRTKVGCEI